MAEQLMTYEDLADMTQFSVETLRNWVYLGKGPASYSIGGRRRFRREDVEAWLEQRREPAPAA